MPLAIAAKPKLDPPAGQALQAVALSSSWYSPAAHLSHAALPLLAATEPALQGVGAVESTDERCRQRRPTCHQGPEAERARGPASEAPESKRRLDDRWARPKARRRRQQRSLEDGQSIQRRGLKAWSCQQLLWRCKLL